jgi:hypothetical protein
VSEKAVGVQYQPPGGSSPPHRRDHSCNKTGWVVLCGREGVCVGLWCDVSVMAKYPPRPVHPATPAPPLAQRMRTGGGGGDGG